MQLPEAVQELGIGWAVGLAGVVAALLVELLVGLALALPALRWWAARRGGPEAAGWPDWLARRGARLRRRVLAAALPAFLLLGLLLVATFPRLPAALGEALRDLAGAGVGALLALVPWALLRIAEGVALAGLLLLAVAGRTRAGAPPALARAGAWLAAAGLAATVASGGLAAQTLDAWRLEALQGELGLATAAAAVGLATGLAAALGLAALLWRGQAWPARRAGAARAALLALALVAAGSGELVREGLRRPWLVGSGRAGALYLDGLTPDEVQRARAGGLASVRPAVAAGGAPSGAALFRAACTPCHSRGELRRALDGLPPPAIAAWLPRLDRMRGRMPPFPGDAADAAALVQWLAGLDGRLDEQLPVPPAPAIAAGRRVMEYRCLTCHRDVPLRRRVAGWSVPFALEAIGRLPRLQPAMPAFAGDEEERRALAAYLSALGAGQAD